MAAANETIELDQCDSVTSPMTPDSESDEATTLGRDKSFSSVGGGGGSLDRSSSSLPRSSSKTNVWSPHNQSGSTENGKTNRILLVNYYECVNNALLLL